VVADKHLSEKHPKTWEIKCYTERNVSKNVSLRKNVKKNR